jgi:hypothetical protein
MVKILKTTPILKKTRIFMAPLKKIYPLTPLKKVRTLPPVKIIIMLGKVEKKEVI